MNNLTSNLSKDLYIYNIICNRYLATSTNGNETLTQIPDGADVEIDYDSETFTVRFNANVYIVQGDYELNGKCINGRLISFLLRFIDTNNNDNFLTLAAYK